jgi:hypothetical protein
VIAGKAEKDMANIGTRRYERSMPHFQLLIPESATRPKRGTKYFGGNN